MFRIKGRSTPVFSLSQINLLAKLSAQIFCTEKIFYKNLKPFALQSSARINELNNQIFLPDAENWEINLEEYQEYITELDWLEKTKKVMEYLFGSAVLVVDSSNINLAYKKLHGTGEVLYDLRDPQGIANKLPEGDHYCIIDSGNLPENVISFSGFKSDIAVEYELNRFHLYETGIGSAVAILKI